MPTQRPGCPDAEEWASTKRQPSRARRIGETGPRGPVFSFSAANMLISTDNSFSAANMLISTDNAGVAPRSFVVGVVAVSLPVRPRPVSFRIVPARRLQRALHGHPAPRITSRVTRQHLVIDALRA